MEQVTQRRFPPPWTVEETDACFIVKDHAGHSLAYVYFEEEPGRRAAAHLLTRDEARAVSHPFNLNLDRSGRRLFRVSYVAQISHG